MPIQCHTCNTIVGTEDFGNHYRKCHSSYKYKRVFELLDDIRYHTPDVMISNIIKQIENVLIYPDKVGE